MTAAVCCGRSAGKLVRRFEAVLAAAAIDAPMCLEDDDDDDDDKWFYMYSIHI